MVMGAIYSIEPRILLQHQDNASLNKILSWWFLWLEKIVEICWTWYQFSHSWRMIERKNYLHTNRKPIDNFLLPQKLSNYGATFTMAQFESTWSDWLYNISIINWINFVTKWCFLKQYWSVKPNGEPISYFNFMSFWICTPQY